MSSSVQAETGAPSFCTAVAYIQQGVMILRDSGTPHKTALENMLIGQIKASVSPESHIIFRLRLTKRIVDFTYLNPQESAKQLQRRAYEVCKNWLRLKEAQ